MINVAVIIETIFAWPGSGVCCSRASRTATFRVVQGVVILAGLMIVTVNLIVDLLYAVIDPRIRYS